jgi:hypothetical protein
MKMSTKSIITLIFISICGITACGQKTDSCNKFAEPSIGVSFCAPSGWIIEKQYDGLQIAFGEEHDGFTPNIGFKSATINGSLSEFVKKSVEGLRKNPQVLNVSSLDHLNYTEFSATSASGYKVIYDFTKDGKKSRTIQYIFNGNKNTIIIFTAVMLFSDKEILEKVFDDSVKTFQLSKI